MGNAASFVQQGASAQRVGLLRGKAVAAVYISKKGAQSERLDDGARRMDRFVGEHGHLAP